MYTAIGASAVSMQPPNLHFKSIECNSVIEQPFSGQSFLNKAKNPAHSIVSGMSQSLRKPLQKDQVCTFEYICENRSLGIALGIGHHDLENWKSSIQANGVVYNRKSNGDFFKIEELSIQQDSGLSCGDEVLTINDVMLDNYSLEDVALLLEKAALSGYLKLVISRSNCFSSRDTDSDDSCDNDFCNDDDLPMKTMTGLMKLYSEPYDIDLIKEECKGIGIGIVGGIDAPHGPIGFFVKAIYPYGLAAEDGRLKKGDEILSLNGTYLNQLTHEQAVNMFRLHSRGPVKLTVRSLMSSHHSLYVSSLSAANQKSSKDSCYDYGGMVSVQENCNAPSDINYLHYETLSECNTQLNVGNEIFDNISQAKYSLEDSMVGPNIKDTSSLVVNEEEPLLLEPVNTDSGSLLFMCNEYDSLMLSTAETRNLHQEENNLQNLFNNGDTQLLNTQFCSSMGMIKKCSNIKDNQDYEFSKELNDDFYELDITNTTSPRPMNFFDSCLETNHLLHMPNDEMCRPKYCIEPQEEFTCSSSMYIADDSESDNEHKRMKSDGNTEGNKHSDIPGEGIGFAWNTVDVDKTFPNVDIIPKGFEDNIVEAKDACKQAVVHYLKDLNVTIGHMKTDELNLNFKSESGSGAYTTNSNVSDLCKYMDTDAILNERGQHSEQTTSYQNKSTLQCDLKLDPKSKIDWHRLTSEENDHTVTLSNLTKSCTNTNFSHIHSKFELPDLQNGDDSKVFPLVINTVQDTAENISFDHTQKDNKMLSKDYMLDNLIKSHPARREETLELLPPPLPSSAPPPLHNCQKSSRSDSMTNMAFDAQCETITFGRDYMAQPSAPSFCPFISTEDQLDVQLKLDKADSMKNDFLWPKVSSIERAEEKSLHSNSCIAPETLKYQHSVKAYFPQITDWQSDLEVASLLSPYLQISNVPASGVNDNLMLEPNQDSLKIKSPSDDIVDCNMLAAEVVSRKQDMIISKYSAIVEDSPLTSLISSKETQEMPFAVLHIAEFYSQNKQICQDKGSESLTRDEKEPFQVKLNKSSQGELGINIVVTAKGAVISSIDRTSSIGQNTNIRVNDYLMAVNGISLKDQTAEEIRYILDNLPLGIIRLTVSTEPASHLTKAINKCSNNEAEFMELQKDKTKKLSESTTDHLTHLTSEVFHSSDCKDHSSIKKYDPATYTYFASKRSLSRDETVGSVLKDYFTIQENETASNKPKKSVIAQALLPKSKRSVSLASETCTSSMPFTSTLNVLTSSVDAVAPASVTRLLSLDQVKLNTDDSASLSSFITKTEEDAIKTVGYKNYLECKTAHKEPNKSTKNNSFGSEQSSSDKFNFNTASESSNIGSTGNLYQLSNESSDKMFEDAETEYTRNVSSSKAFFESITDPSNKSLAMNVRRSSDNRNKRTNHSNAYGEQENGILAKFDSEKSSCLELKTTNMADELILERFYKPKTIYNPISKLPTTGLSSLASDELWLKTDKNFITSDFERNPGSKSLAESTSISKSGSKFMNENILKETENQKCVWLLENVYSKRITKNATESDAIIDSDRISMPENKSLLKSKENSRKIDNTGMQILATTPMELTTIVKPGLGTNLSEDKSTTAVNEFDCSGASICMQDHEYSSNCDGDLVNVNETTAYFESLKSSTYSLLPGQKDLISCKLNAAAQDAIGKGDISGKSFEFFSDSSILPDTCSAQSQNQPIFQRNSTKSTSAQTFGRHSSLPSQKYLPVSEKKISKPKPAANFMVSSQTSQRMVDSNSKQKKQSLLMPNSSETPFDQKHQKIGKGLSLRESETSQNTVESLASKYTTLLPSQTSFHDERKQDPSVLAKHTNADHTRFQPNNVYGKSPLVKDAGIGNLSTAKKPTHLKKPLPPLPSSATPSTTATATGGNRVTTELEKNALTTIGIGVKPMKWKQFFTDYSTMK